MEIPKRKRLDHPILYVNDVGEKALLSVEDTVRVPLTYDGISLLMSQAVLKNQTFNQLLWCNLIRRKFIPKTVIIIAEGVGQMELEDLKQWKYENNVKDNDEGPPKKRMKTCDDGTHKKLSNYSSLVADFLPKSEGNFPLQLELKSPAETDSCPVEQLLTLSLTTPKIKKIMAEYAALYKAGDILCYTRTNKAAELINQSIHPTVKHDGDKMNRMDLLLSFKELVKYKFPAFMPGNKASSDPQYQYLHPVVEEVTPTSPMFGVDCEMCVTSDLKTQLTRVAVVNEEYEVVYSSYVKPDEKIINYVTKYSGVSKKSLKNVKIRLKDVQNALRKKLPKNCILVGHSLDGDLHALKLVHPYLIDTSLIFNLTGQRFLRSKLKILSKLFLGKSIQCSEVIGHSPLEDAAAALELAQLKLRNNLSFGDRVKTGEIPFRSEEEKKVISTIKREKSVTAFTRTFAEVRRKLSNVITEEKIKWTFISSTNSYDRLKKLLKENDPNFEYSWAEDIERVFDIAAEQIPQRELIVCHMKIVRSSPGTAKVARKQLERLDSELNKFHSLLPQKSLIAIVFPGSDNPSSKGFVLVDVIGQYKETFISKKK